ncbi:MAG: TolC family protein, partial [Chlorobiales bacterium]|nr:TolC family protein [Chlorobiales bacterium]
LFDGFGNIYTFKKLKSAGRLGRFQARNAIEQVILQVSEAYYNLADASKQVAVAEEALAISGDRLKRARLRSEYGQANTLEVLSASVDVNADSVAWKEAVLGMENANRRLNLLLDRPIDASYGIRSDVSFDKGLEKEEILQSAKQSFSAYLAARESVKQAEYDLGITRSDFFPELGVQAGYGFSNTLAGFDPGTDDLSGNFSAALTLNFNLFNGFQSSIRRQNARIELQNAKLLEQKALSELEKQVADTWQEYLNTLDILEFQKKNLETAELNFRRSKELYVLGQLTTTTFREAQLNLINARKSIASAGYDAKILELKLKRFAGKLVQEGK